MTAKCPKCQAELSVFELQRVPFTCKHCGSRIIARTPTLTYIAYRLLAGGIAMWVASPIKECDLCNWAVILIVIAVLALLVVKMATRIELVNEED